MPVPFDHGENMWVSANYVIVNVHILISLYLYFNSIAFHMLIHKHYDLLVFSIQHITCFPKSSQFIHECYFTLYASLLSRRYSYNDLITLHYGKFLDNIATCYRSYFEDWKAYIRDNSRWNYIMLMNFEKKIWNWAWHWNFTKHLLNPTISNEKPTVNRKTNTDLSTKWTVTNFRDE